MKEMLYEVRCLKSNEDMILALAGQFKQLSHEPEKSDLLLNRRTATWNLFVLYNNKLNYTLTDTKIALT